MPIASDETSREYDPNDLEHWIDVRELGHGDIRTARNAALAAYYANQKAMGPELYTAQQDRWERQSERRTTDTVADPVNLYDCDVCLDRGIAGWNFPTSLPERGPERARALSKLKPTTAEWAHRMVLKYAGIDNWSGDASKRRADVVEGSVTRTDGEGTDAESDPTSISLSLSTGT